MKREREECYRQRGKVCKDPTARVQGQAEEQVGYDIS